jgi:hypothetical protein
MFKWKLRDYGDITEKSITDDHVFIISGMRKKSHTAFYESSGDTILNYVVFSRFGTGGSFFSAIFGITTLANRAMSTP